MTSPTSDGHVSATQLQSLLERVETSDVRRCPFDGPNELLPSDPCPVCGETGEFEDENSTGAKCVGTSWMLLQKDLAAMLRALLSLSGGNTETEGE